MQIIYDTFNVLRFTGADNRLDYVVELGSNNLFTWYKFGRTFMFLSLVYCHFFLPQPIFHQSFLTFFSSRSSSQLHPTAWTEYPFVIIQIDLASSTIFLTKKVTIIYTTLFATGIRIQPFAYITTNHEEEQSKSKTFF